MKMEKTHKNAILFTDSIEFIIKSILMLPKAPVETKRE